MFINSNFKICNFNATINNGQNLCTNLKIDFKKLVLTNSLTFLAILTCPQDKSSIYNPFHIGNSWTYLYRNNNIITEQIIDTVTINENIYYGIDNWSSGYFLYNKKFQIERSYT